MLRSGTVKHLFKTVLAAGINIMILFFFVGSFGSQNF